MESFSASSNGFNAAVAILVNLLANTNSTSEAVQEGLNQFFRQLPHAYEQQVVEAMIAFSNVFENEAATVANVVNAVMLCGYLVEDGYDARPFIEQLNQAAVQFFQISMPFMQALQQAYQNLDEENDDPDEVLSRVRESFEEGTPQQTRAFDLLESIYPCLVTCYCTNHSFWLQGKALLQSTVEQFCDISSACHWLNTLFGVLFQEPVLVIEESLQKGFVGTISGVADNFQLQLLLMTIPDLGTPINPDLADVIKGSGPQSANTSLPGRWDMCNWTILSAADDETENNRKTDHWIWSEGKLADIELLDGYRVIILQNASYQRGLPVQRSFKMLEASVNIDRWLEKQELADWLQKMT